MNWILFLGSLLGLSAVAMGAYVNHVAAIAIDFKTITMLKTALQYQLLHAVVISMLGFTQYLPLSERHSRYLVATGWMFIIGLCFFSFTIYVAGLGGIQDALKLTPIGGFLLMLAWLLMACSAWFKQAKKH